MQKESHEGTEQMCCCFPAAGCWWLRPNGSTHSQETHCQRRGGDTFFSLPLLFSFLVTVVWFHYLVLHTYVSITDDRATKFRTGNVCPWCLSQGCVRSYFHLVGGEDQPVSGFEGALTLTYRQYYIFMLWCLLLYFTLDCIVCTNDVMQDEIYHSSKASTVIGLLDIYGFEVLQHNR